MCSKKYTRMYIAIPALIVFGKTLSPWNRRTLINVLYNLSVYEIYLCRIRLACTV